jgi:hypothetical protein
MPTTLSTVPRPKCITSASTAVENATWSSSSGVTSLKFTPGLGKSGMSRM